MAARQDEFLGEAAALAVSARVATLATVEDGAPYASLVTPGWAGGCPILLLSSLSAHTRQLRANPACALLLTGPAAGENPQTAPRLSLACRAVPADEPALRAVFLRTHPYAALYVDFADFGFWRLSPHQAAYIGGFAAAATLGVAALQQEIINAAAALS